MSPPKEFGGRSPQGLADLRGLDQLDMPYAKSPGVDHISFKAGGFNRVDRKPLPPAELPGVFLSEGRRSPSTGSHIALSSSPSVPAKDFPASVIAGTSGSITYVGRNRVSISGFTGNFVGIAAELVARATSNFKDVVTERTTYYIPSQLTGSLRVTNTPRAVSATADYTTESAQAFVDGSMMPYVLVRKAGGIWSSSPTEGYPEYDHYVNNGLQQISPSTLVGLWGVFARQTFFRFATGTRPNSPAGVATPYPLLLTSFNSGESFVGLPMDLMFAGLTTQWAAFGGAGTPPLGNGVGGYEPSISFRASALRNLIVMGFRAVDNSGSKVYRLFVGPASGNIPTTAIQVSTPPGFNSAWISITDIFSDARTNSIILIARPTTLTPLEPIKIFVSTDFGASWITHTLPWWSMNTGEIRPHSRTQLSACVYNPVRVGVEFYLSSDLGATWKLAGMVAQNTFPPDASSFEDFSRVIQIGVDSSGTEPVVNPMAPYINDHHYRY